MNNINKKRIYICGAHGVGKTTISNELANAINGYKAIDGSKFCIQYIQDVFGVLNPNDNNITPTMKKEIIDNALKDGLKKVNGGIIVTGHGYLTPEVYNLFDHILFVSRSPNRIYENRIKDIIRQNTRPREISNIEDIEKEQASHFERIKSIDILNKLIIIHNESSIAEVVNDIKTLINL